MKLKLAIAAIGATFLSLSTEARPETVVVQASNAYIVNESVGSALINGMAGSTLAVTGDGKIISENRHISAVPGVQIRGAFEVTIAVGEGPSLILEGDENVLPLIRTEVSGGALRIFSLDSYITTKPVKIILSLLELTDLLVTGSSAVAARGFDQKDLRVSLNGSNSAVLSGKVLTLDGVLSGSGTLTAVGLRTETAKIRVSGAGTSSLTVHKKVTAEIFGAGVIVIHGNPSERTTHVNGAGNIAFAN